MKRLIYSSALLAALTIPALAGTDSKDMKDMKQVAPMQQSDAGFYVAAYGGAQFDTGYGDNRQTLSTPAGSTTTTNLDIHSHWGGVGGFKAGYNFESFPVGNMFGLRLQPGMEFEALYIGMDPSFVNAGVPNTTERFSTNSAAVFVNGILRFKNESIVTPYIGAGIGGEYITQHDRFYTPASETGLVTSDFDFAGQALFGLDVQICQHVSLFSEYKWIDAIGTDAKSTNGPGGSTYRFKPDQIQQNLITAGVKYTF